jgi:hypothetical protein
MAVRLSALRDGRYMYISSQRFKDTFETFCICTNTRTRTHTHTHTSTQWSFTWRCVLRKFHSDNFIVGVYRKDICFKLFIWRVFQNPRLDKINSKCWSNLNNFASGHLMLASHKSCYFHDNPATWWAARWTATTSRLGSAAHTDYQIITGTLSSEDEVADGWCWPFVATYCRSLNYMDI